MILDTDILIWRLRGHPRAIALIGGLAPAERNLSVISYLELLYGCRDKAELRLLSDSITGHFAQVFPVTPEISDSALSIMEGYALARRPEVTDTLIAATAVARGEVLVTANRKDFDFIPNLKLHVFRP